MGVPDGAVVASSIARLTNNSFKGEF